jgi:hypothetical protein
MEMMLMSGPAEPTSEACQRLCATRHNVLLHGPAEAIDAALALIAPSLRSPLVWKKAESKFDPPVGTIASLILQDVGSLTQAEQIQLLGWLDNAKVRPQIVSTTTVPIFPLVERGVFDAALYYRLNIMLLDVKP